MKVIIFLIIVTLFLLSRIKIDVTYRRLNKDDRLDVTVSYLYILKYKFHLSFVEISKYENELGFKIKSSLKNKEEGFIDFKSVIQAVKRYKLYYKIYTRIFIKMLKAFKKGLIISKNDICLEVGLNDNALTGTLIGLLYATLWSLFGIARSSLDIDSTNIKINPNFNRLIFELEILCIIKMRIGNIICVGLYFCVILFFVFAKYITNSFKNQKIKKGGVIHNE